MTVEKDIKQLEDLLANIEDYVSQGVFIPARHKEILSALDEADDLFNRIINTYIDVPDRPSFEQAYLVSNLQERLHNAKHGLPAPPLNQKHSAGSARKKVIIYTTPT